MPENTPKFYLDTCVFIDLIEHGPLSDKGKLLTSLFEDAEARKCELVTSVITIAEVLWAKAEKDGKKVSPKTQQIINALWHPQSSPVRLIDVHEAIARDAQNLLRSHLHKGWTKTGAVDAVALVTARREREPPSRGARGARAVTSSRLTATSTAPFPRMSSGESAPLVDLLSPTIYPPPMCTP